MVCRLAGGFVLLESELMLKKKETKTKKTLSSALLCFFASSWMFPEQAGKMAARIKTSVWTDEEPGKFFVSLKCG